jgi:hypothetical protein
MTRQNLRWWLGCIAFVLLFGDGLFVMAANGVLKAIVERPWSWIYIGLGIYFLYSGITEDDVEARVRRATRAK